jgi:microcin C transport system substrate-binding protein
LDRFLCAALAAILAIAPATAEDAPKDALKDASWRHGLSLLGEPRYPADFRHFDYVDPDAPKGGVVRLGVQDTFDNFNLFVSGVKGAAETGIALVYDTLMETAQDEVGTEYGLLAEAVRHPPDNSSVTYRLRREARWHDGRPVTAADVIFSFTTFKANSPQYAFYYKNVARAEETGEREVTFTFSEKGNRELPHIIGQLPVLPKHWWEGEAQDGRRRDPTETTLEPPLGSGPYRLKAFDAGRTAAYERVPDYWGRDLPVNRGRHNFSEIRYEYYRDSTVLLEAFKGDRYDFRSENSARNWATAYDFPAIREGRVIREEFPVRATGVMQAFVLNLRRQRFQDARVRRAFNLAFDFEDINRTIFYGLYKRTDSFFAGTELASSGLPEGREPEILESVRAKVPASVFAAPYANPVNGSPEKVRANLREALRLLGEAGYELKNQRLVDKKTGEPFTVEFLGYDTSLERFVMPYVQALGRIGITMSIRTVDAAQFQNRLRSFDFDVTTDLWAQSLSPGNEQREFWGSGAADRPGSRNTAGIRGEGVDALIERVIFAKDRDELVAATKALDRVLLHHDYVVPQFYAGQTRTARWDRFARPKNLPEYGGSGFPTIWWYDPAKAAKTGAPR